MIGLTKKALRKAIGNKRLTQKQLVTMYSISYVDEDINSSPILTPIDFLSFHTFHVIPDLTEEVDPKFDFTKTLE